MVFALVGLCPVFAASSLYKAKAGTETSMASQPPTDSNCGSAKSTSTEHIVHDFISAVAPYLQKYVYGPERGLSEDRYFGQDSDGQFRLRAERSTFGLMLTDEDLSKFPGYQECVSCLSADPTIGPHIGCMVGTQQTLIGMYASNVIKPLLYTALGDGEIKFSSERFQTSWQEMMNFFSANQIELKTVAPLPYLTATAFPIRLNEEIVLDRLTADEVTRCYRVGVLQTMSPSFPLLDNRIAVGVRRIRRITKVVQSPGTEVASPDDKDEGNFGRRPYWRDDLMVDDVLSALRLFKPTSIRTAGFASWTDAYFLRGGTTFRQLGQSHYHGKLELAAEDIPQLIELWNLLAAGAARFGFSIRRFNLAFDRGLIEDRVVDLVIAAEALFLGDIDDQYRGELRYRFALRAAKFITGSSYSEIEVYRLMRRAYDARSAIVHGGTPKSTSLPDNPTANLHAFADAVENLVRLGLRKVLSMQAEASRLRQADYWDGLVFPNES